MYEVQIEKTFSSAHFLRNYHGKDEPLHGHNWRVQVKFRGAKLIEPEEFLVDFVEAHDALSKVISKVDYKNINEVPPFNKEKNASTENIARWICEELSKSLAVKPSAVTVWETESGAASYIPD